MKQLTIANLNWFAGLSMGFGMGFLLGREGLKLILFALVFILIGFILNIVANRKSQKRGSPHLG